MATVAEICAAVNTCCTNVRDQQFKQWVLQLLCSIGGGEAGVGAGVSAVELWDVQAGGTAVPYLLVITISETGVMTTALRNQLNTAAYVPTGTASSASILPAVDVAGTRTFITSSAAGTVVAGKQRVEFFNPAAVGGATVLVDGVAIAGQERVNAFTAYHDVQANTFVRSPAIGYDGSGGVLHVTVVD